MNFTCGAPLALALGLVAAVTAAGEDAPPPEWRWQPALYVLGTLDDTTGSGAALFNGELREPSPGLGLGASLDGARQWSRASFETNLLALTRSPQDADDRSLSLVGRARASRELGTRVRVALNDSAKLQRRANGFASDFQRNELQLEVLGLAGGWGEVGVQATDRRRSVDDVRELGFDLQSAALVWNTRPARQLGLRLVAGLQHTHAPSARGRRWQVVLEGMRLHRSGVVALRVLYVQPRGAARAAGALGSVPFAPTLPPGANLVGVPNAVVDAARASFLATATTVAAEASLPPPDDALADTLWLDPLQEDADEWDFGRRKRGFVAFGSRRAGRVGLSARVSFLSRRGPDLLQAAPTPEYHEERWEVRTGAHWRLTRRVGFLVQASYLDSNADRPALDYRRVLAAAGVQLSF